MHFNVEKCQFMSVTRKINPHRYDYTMNGKSLLKVSQFKDLGIIITDTMAMTMTTITMTMTITTTAMAVNNTTMTKAMAMGKLDP